MLLKSFHKLSGRKTPYDVGFRHEPGVRDQPGQSGFGRFSA